MMKKNSNFNLLACHLRRRHRCSCHRHHCPLCCQPPSSPFPSSSLSPSPSLLLARHPHCRHHCPLCCCCSLLTCNPCCHCHCLVALALFVAHHPNCRCHCPCSPHPFPLCHPPASSPLPLLLPLPSPATLDAIAIALAIISIALFVARHPHCCGHRPLRRHRHCSPTTLVTIAITLFASAAIHVDCHCTVAAVLPSIAPPPLTAMGIVLPLLLSPIVTPAVTHHCHRRPSPPLLPIMIVLPSHHLLHIHCHHPLQLCCYCACRSSTCQLVVTLDWLSLRHLHTDGVVVSHLFPTMDNGVTASSVAAAVFLGAIVP
jgi:hypothetical protein